MKDFLDFLAEKKLLMNISEQKYYVRQKKDPTFLSGQFLSLVSGGVYTARAGLPRLMVSPFALRASIIASLC